MGQSSGSNKLKFNRSGFDTAVSAVDLAGQSIEPSPFNNIGDIDAGDCKEITIQGYVERLLELSALLADYRTLVENDMRDFKKLGEVIEQSEAITSAGISAGGSGGGIGGTW